MPLGALVYFMNEKIYKHAKVEKNDKKKLGRGVRLIFIGPFEQFVAKERRLEKR